MYTIDDLNLRLLSELKDIAEQVGVKNAKKLSSAGHLIRLRGLGASQHSIVRITGLLDVLNVAGKSSSGPAD